MCSGDRCSACLQSNRGERLRLSGQSDQYTRIRLAGLSRWGRSAGGLVVRRSCRSAPGCTLRSSSTPAGAEQTDVETLSCQQSHSLHQNTNLKLTADLQVLLLNDCSVRVSLPEDGLTASRPARCQYVLLDGSKENETSLTADCRPSVSARCVCRPAGCVCKVCRPSHDLFCSRLGIKSVNLLKVWKNQPPDGIMEANQCIPE